MNNSSSEFPKRKKNRLDGYDYSSAGAYFVTVCIKDAKNLLWNRVGADIIRPDYELVEELQIPLSHIGKTVETAIKNIPAHYNNASADKYCIMPNHIHMIISINADEDGRMISAPTIPQIVGQTKRWVSKQLGISIWQKSFFDSILSSDNAYLEAWQYINNNPRKISKEYKE